MELDCVKGKWRFTHHGSLITAGDVDNADGITLRMVVANIEGEDTHVMDVTHDGFKFCDHKLSCF